MYLQNCHAYDSFRSEKQFQACFFCLATSAKLLFVCSLELLNGTNSTVVSRVVRNTINQANNKAEQAYIV